MKFPNMKVPDKKILELVRLGWNQRTKGQYKNAYTSYNKALEYNSKHWLVRNAMAELLFIDRKYLSAAENYYIAAVDNSTCLSLDLIFNENLSDKDYIVLRNHRIEKAERLLINYAMKTGIAVFAHQYDNPTDKTPQQAVINRYRNEYDPYGYSSFTDVTSLQMKQITEKAIGFGYDFLDTMNQRQRRLEDEEFPLELIFKFFNPAY